MRFRFRWIGESRVFLIFIPQEVSLGSAVLSMDMEKGKRKAK